MKKILMLAICITALELSGCASNMFQSAVSAITPGGSQLGGQLANLMNETDINNMSHALDKGLGKPTSWTSTKSGINYTVVPTEKLTINGNPYCRKYQITGRKNNQENSHAGTACVSLTDSSWQVVN